MNGGAIGKVKGTTKIGGRQNHKVKDEFNADKESRHWMDDEWENEQEQNEGVIDEMEAEDPVKHASATFFSPESNKARVSTSSHLSLTFAQ